MVAGAAVAEAISEGERGRETGEVSISFVIFFASPRDTSRATVHALFSSCIFCSESFRGSSFFLLMLRHEAADVLQVPAQATQDEVS